MINVFFKGSGTWFNKDNGDLIYPLQGGTGSFFQFPPVYQISGIFLLNDEDVETYRYTKNLEHVRKLLPSKDRENSAFLKMVNEGIFTNEDADHLYFKLPRKRKALDKSKFVKHPDVLVIADEPSNTVTTVKAKPPKKKESENEKRLDSLRKFIEWLNGQATLHKLDFNKYQLDCTKSELFRALKVWEADHITTVSKRVWHKPEGWNSCGKLWDSTERKAICDIANDRQGRPKNDQPKNPENIFKKINMLIFI